MGRPPEHAGRRADLGEPPSVHHGDPDGQRRGDGQVVRDVDNSAAVDPGDLLDRLQDASLGRHIEAGRRLVHDDEPRPVDDRHRDHNPLLLTSGELVRV